MSFQISNPTGGAGGLTSQVLQGFQERSREIDEQMAEVDEKINNLRTTSQPVPTGYFTEDFTAGTDDQRASHYSPDPHTFMPPPAKAIYNRRYIVENDENSGLLTFLGTLIGANPDGTGTITNLILKAGEVAEYKGNFRPNDGGIEDAPADLEINGAPAPAGTKGSYIYKLVSLYNAKLPPEEILEKFGDLGAKTDAALTTANQANARLLSLLGGLLPEDLDQILEIAIRILTGETKTAALVAQLNQIAATATEANARSQAVQTLLTDTTPDADAIVNRITEALAILQNYPEGANLLQELEKKINTLDVVNNLAQTAVGKVLDARQGKALLDLITPLQTRPRVIFSSGTPSTPISATTTNEQFFLQNVPLAANLIIPDRVFTLGVMLYGTFGASPPNVVFRIRVGGVIFLASIAIPPGAGKVNQPIHIEATITGVSAGVSGLVEPHGKVWISSSTHFPLVSPLASAVTVAAPLAASTPINTTVENNFQLSVQFSTAPGAQHFIQRRTVFLRIEN